MKKYILAIVAIISISMVSDKNAYLVFDKNGNISKYENMLEAAKNADIVLFGELHTNPICHWLEIELTKDLHKTSGKDIVMGAEMFETDNQLILNEYLSGRIKEANFEAEAKLWPNYKSDYKVLINFAKKNKLNFIATNVPRRYASLVNRSGFEALDSLSIEAKTLFSTLPIKYNAELGCYKNLLKSAAMGKDTTHVNINLPKAQALKDATMVNSILKNYKKNQLFIHYNGTYHSEDFESMVWYLKEMNPKLKIITIASVEQENIETLTKENINKADFILCIPESMTN